MDPAAVEATRRRLTALSTSAVADARGGRGVLGSELRRLSGTGTVAGPAITAACTSGSSLPILAALDQARPGGVLCVAALGPWAYIGDLLGTQIAKRGIVAVVIDGLVRDSDVLRASTVSYHVRGTTPAALRHREPGPSLLPVTLGGEVVETGDWIVADDDGAVVIPAKELEETLGRSEKIAARERGVRELIEGGMDIRQAFASVNTE